MKVNVLTEIQIARPRDAVFEYSSNPDNAPIWYANIKSVEWKTASPMVLGSRFAFVANFLGKRLAYTYEVVELIADERLVMRTTEGPFPMETTYTWRSIENGGTYMSLRNAGTPGGFSKLVAPFMSVAMKRENRKDLARLKSILEK